MERNSQQLNNPHKLPDLLCVLVDETLGNALLEEIKHCRSLIDSFSERHSYHIKRASEKADQKSITGYLFESVDVTSNTMLILDNYLQKFSEKRFDAELLKFNKEAIKLLNIVVEPIKGKYLDQLSDSILAGFKNTLDTILQKKTTREDASDCYQYFHLIYNVLQSHINKIGDFEKRRLKILIDLWNKSKLIDANVTTLSKHNYDFDTSKNEFNLDADFTQAEVLLNNLAQEAIAIINTLQDAIKNAFEDLENNKHLHAINIKKSKNKYNPEHVIKASNTIEKAYQHSREEWHNTMLALSDDWALEMEIRSLKFHILKGYFTFVNYVDNKLKNPLDEKVNDMKVFTEELKNTFKPKDDLLPDEIIDIIKKRKSEFNRKLKFKILPEIKDILVNGDLPKVVDDFEQNTIIQFETLSKSKLLIKNPIYEQPIDRSEMHKISPHALVSFEMQPKFIRVFPSLKNAIIRQLQVLQVKLEEIPEIVEFSIDSAIGYYESKQDLNESLKVGNEGIKRAINKIDDLIDLRSEFYNSEVDLLNNKINQLIEQIYEITDNESALQIKIRVTKARALEHSKAMRDKMILKVKNFLPVLLNKLNTLYNYLLATSIKIRKQFEGENKKKYISTDISDYLAETENAINRLPFVYQRLFKIEPLSSFDLYIEQEEAENTFKKAYSKWANGKYAPTIITGEKGSGKTSFINRLLSDRNINEEIIRHDLHKEYVDPATGLNTINESLTDLLNQQTDGDIEIPKKIIIVDGFERLFEARINGFLHINKILKLISQSNPRIFWIVICNLYSYNFLEKSLNISDYFGYHIKLEDLSVDKLKTIIDKRHNISGFRLNFLAYSQKKSIIPIIKQGEKTDQEVLKEEYFKKLQGIVRGNITQAFLYWMRSAAQVTEDVIYINMLSDTNLDFVNSISLSKFEILKNIIIHNGISAAKHAETFRIEVEKSELQLEQLFDDGIIIKRSGIYNINPMIYKQVIDRMYNLNLIH